MQGIFQFFSLPLFKIENFMIGSINDKRRTSHNDEHTKGKRMREEIGKERANKTTKVKWGREKREANNVMREIGL